MDKEFVPYEQALELKELGFKEECAAHYLDENDLELKWKIYRNLSINTNDCIQAPLYQQAFRWFREKYELRNSITDFIDDKTGIEWDYEIAIIGTDLDEKGNYKPLVDYSVDDETRKFKTHEEAELGCLIKLIEIVIQIQFIEFVKKK